ncbi:MAG: TonB-dependent receptor [Tannerellaceae bacterium]|nr:TonB-dependent receptor [Tannerellaceae bacterium]
MKKELDDGKKLLLKITHIMKISFLITILCVIHISATTTHGEGISQQTREISGTVTDTNGEAIIGANISVKGTSIGTISDIDGNYILANVPGNSILVFSYLGMKTQEISVGDKRLINVILEVSAIDLQEVVAVGYITQKKVDLTGAIAVADVEKIRDSPSPNIMKSLQGQVPGLYVTTDGNPAGGATVRIRGVSTLNNNDPLYIIDGVPTKSNALQMLNPNDIQSIQVLKDASSAAIYGSRASNGVIIVETKNASGEKVEISYTTMLTHSSYGSKPKLLNAKGRATVAWRAMVYDGGNPDDIPHVNYDWYRDESGKAILRGISFPEYIVPGLRTADTDWYDTMSRDGFIQDHNLSISTGTKTTGTRLSFRYYDDKYIHKFKNAKSYSARINTYQNLFNDRIKIGQNLTVSNNVDHGYDGNVHLDRSLKVRPILPIYYDDGSYSGPPSGAFTDDKNPLMILDIEQDDKRDNLNVFGNVYANVKISDKIQWNTSYGIDLNHHHNKNIDRSFLTGIKARNVNSVMNLKSQNFTWMLNSTLQYDLDLKGHQFMFLAGGEAIKNTYEYSSSTREVFSSQDVDYFYESAGSGASYVAGGANDYSLLSFFGKINYNSFDKYLASATLRYDGTSRVGSNNRFGVFPSFSAGWRISEEAFFKENINLFSNLKLRGSWGKTGNQEISTTAIYTMYQTHYGENAIAFNSDNGTAYDFNGADTGSLMSGYRKSQTGNNDLKWEETTELNFGIDLGLNRTGLSASFDYFSRNTSNILISPAFLAVQGDGGNRWLNGATVENKGFEILIEYRGQARDWDYSASFNIGHYADKITELPEDVIKSYPGNNEKNILGRSMNSLFGYVADGVFKTQEEVDQHATQPGKRIGRLKFKNLNGDKNIDLLDQDWLGTSTPKYEFGLNLNANYKNFDFNVFFQGVLGRTVYDSFKRYTDFSSLWAGTNWGERTLDAWTPENPNSDIPAATLVDDNNEGRYSSYFLSNGSYMKMRRITLGYSLHDISILKQLRFYVTGENLLTIKDTKGSNAFTSPDPENPGNGFARPQNITFGISVTF